VSRAGSELGSI